MDKDAQILPLNALIISITLGTKVNNHTQLVVQPGVLVVSAFAVLCSAGGSTGAQLKYKITPNLIVPYKVNIVANTPSSKDTMTGTIAFTGTQSGDAQFTASYAGSLSRRTTQALSSGRDGLARFEAPVVLSCQVAWDEEFHWKD